MHLGIVPIELAGGHCPHISRPGELADVLGKLAGPPQGLPPLAGEVTRRS
jgi:hypothetical protein